ncbi:hypothetical protein JGUZn3_06560 [Entomobacter blattae]|uniref:Uncharacterized protein n=1 Tax=Entomobacter blattae TaxID=2762277 RepID=A0A7H1NQ38_9PROT|nr:hypothetical protein JGUZn3_06560 [Entomobacter blattae]
MFFLKRAACFSSKILTAHSQEDIVLTETTETLIIYTYF